MKITGAMVFDPKEGFVQRDLCIAGDRIAPQGEGEVSARGCCLIPGLTDLHFHGCRGEDFSDGSPEGLEVMARYELSRGVTQICPAGMTLLEDQLVHICQVAAAHRAADKPGAMLCGVNLEGPFLCYAKRGAQAAENLHKPDAGLFHRLNEASGGQVKLVTVACEEEGAIPFIRELSQVCTVSLGHTTADYDTAMAGFQAGATHATHLYNGMPSFLHRAPGVIGAAFDADASVELICDGLHIHPSVIRATYQLFGDKLNLISDSLRCAGMPDGDYELGGQPIVVKNHKATLLDGTLAGSSISLLDAVRNVVRFGLSLEAAVYAASTAPAQAVGLDAGVIAQGRCADLLVLDESLALKAVFVDGQRL